ncbi:hypothetical protein JW711_05465 [Candidatus Woesearchaeota archaeon]|nr:hypothetical protein [Candidatus Woesearchaeota archaeon]
MSVYFASFPYDMTGVNEFFIPASSQQKLDTFDMDGQTFYKLAFVSNFTIDNELDFVGESVFCKDGSGKEFDFAINPSTFTVGDAPATFKNGVKPGQVTGVGFEVLFPEDMKEFSCSLNVFFGEPNQVQGNNVKVVLE